MTFPYLYRKEVEDEFAQDNFVRIAEFFALQALTRCDFKFFTIPITSAVTSYKFPHGLNLVPQDIIVTQNSQNVTLTWNWSEFDERFLSLTTSGATNIRALIGRYRDG